MGSKFVFTFFLIKLKQVLFNPDVTITILVLDYDLHGDLSLHCAFCSAPYKELDRYYGAI